MFNNILLIIRVLDAHAERKRDRSLEAGVLYEYRKKKLVFLSGDVRIRFVDGEKLFDERFSVEHETRRTAMSVRARIKTRHRGKNKSGKKGGKEIFFFLPSPGSSGSDGGRIDAEAAAAAAYRSISHLWRNNGWAQSAPVVDRRCTRRGKVEGVRSAFVSHTRQDNAVVYIYVCVCVKEAS